MDQNFVIRTNQVPVFAVCVENQPLKVNVDRKPLALFFVDLAMAQNEMKMAQKALPKAMIDLVQFPLGEAFVGWYQETARIMPTVEALRASGAPRNSAPIDSMVPLFAANLQLLAPDGTPSVPLFFVEAEAKAALQAARNNGQNVDPELMKLPLQKAVFLLATDADAPAFQFMTPAASTEYIARVLGQR
jgi:hypothetical protein